MRKVRCKDMSRKNIQLTELLITALGIETLAKNIGYSIGGALGLASLGGAIGASVGHVISNGQLA